MAHLLRRSALVIAISERTRIDILDLFPAVEPKVKVVHLGPGIVKPDSFSRGEPETVLLVGRAKHKQNELTAHALCMSRPPWAQKIIGLNVSNEVRSILETGFGSRNCEWHYEVDEETAASLYVRAAIFINLSMEEGFGLPFIEALTAGCQVVAARQPLTEALLDDVALLIDGGPVGQVAAQLTRLTSRTWPEDANRRARAAVYSWDSTADMIASFLFEAASS